MPPKARFTADKILDAAVELTRTQGIMMVTARNLAGAIGSSTGPIFTHFGSMDGLNEALMDRIIALFVTMAGSEQHTDPLLSAGLGWLRFASEEPRLYEAVFLTKHPWHAKWGPVRLQLASRMATHVRYAHLDERARFALVGKASIVMHGLGLEIWSDRMPSHDHTLLLKELVDPVVKAALEQEQTHDLHSSAPLLKPKRSSSNKRSTSSKRR